MGEGEMIEDGEEIGTEVDEDSEVEEAFAAEVAGEADKEESEEEEEKEDGSDDDSKSDDDEEEKEKTAQEKLEERAEGKESDEGKAEDDKEADDDDEEDLPPVKYSKVDKEDVEAYLSENYKSLFPKGKVEFRGKTIDFEDYFEDFPEESDINFVVANVVAENIVHKSIQNGTVVSSEVFKSGITAIQENFTEALKQIDFRQRVSVDHPGWEKMVKTDEFKSWKDDQGKKIQLLYDSEDHEDGIAMLDAYVEDKGRKKMSAADEKEAKKHGRKNDLYRSTGKTSAKRTKADKAPKMDEIEEAFAEEVAASS